MRIFQAGTQSVAVVAIGVQATGIIAIGPLANGVLAIGQLATGVIAIGQVSVGLLSIGQLALSPFWVAGMLGIAPLSGGGMLMLTPLGTVPISGVIKGRATFRRSSSRGLTTVAIVFAIVAPIWWFAGAVPLIDAITRVGGIFRARHRVLG